jgi:hypothetical protein
MFLAIEFGGKAQGFLTVLKEPDQDAIPSATAAQVKSLDAR